MSRAERTALLAIPIILLLGAGIAWAGSQGGAEAFGLPVFLWCAILAFGLNWAVFVPAFVFQTEKFFDLTGSITYVSLVVVATVLSGEVGARGALIAALVVLWAGRLGSFLFGRIRKDGSDGRFDVLKPSFPRFLMTWTLQGLWVLLTLSCGLAAMTAAEPGPLDAFAIAGALLFAAGFGIEVVADRQKTHFRSDPANRHRFITTGIWAWSRHPNYFGEILLWGGVAVAAVPALSGWQYATLVSPVFVYVLLTRISGVPMLEARANKKWGNEPDYVAYKERTPVLFLRPPRPA